MKTPQQLLAESQDIPYPGQVCAVPLVLKPVHWLVKLWAKVRAMAGWDVVKKP